MEGDVYAMIDHMIDEALGLERITSGARVALIARVAQVIERAIRTTWDEAGAQLIDTGRAQQFAYKTPTDVIEAMTKQHVGRAMRDASGADVARV